MLTLSISLISTLLAPTALLISLKAVPNQFEKTFLGELNHKLDLIKKDSDRPRVIIIGGSSTPFSIRSELIENELPYIDVIDFGLYAALGSRIMLELAKPYIKENDTIIFSPEQNKDTLSLYFNPSLTLLGLENDLSLINELPKDMQKELYNSLYSFASSRINYYLTNSTPNPQDIYKKDSFDVNGDINSSLCESNVMDLGYNSSSLIYLNEEIIDDDFIVYLNEYNETIDSKGAKMYYRFAPMNKGAIVGDIDTYFDYLNSSLNFNLIGNPHNSIFEMNYFYDTNYHLNNSGAILNTYHLVNDLKILYHDNKENNIKIPPMPSLNNSLLKEGNNDYIDNFEYEEINNNYIISSLVKDDNRIVIPYSYKNKKIISIKENVFKNSNIEEIVIQDNISSLGDNLFKNTKIKRITILNNNPSSIRVSSSLLDGSNAKIYVPRDCLSSYKTNYFWSNYSSSIFAIEEK